MRYDYYFNFENDVINTLNQHEVSFSRSAKKSGTEAPSCSLVFANFFFLLRSFCVCNREPFYHTRVKSKSAFAAYDCQTLYLVLVFLMCLAAPGHQHHAQAGQERSGKDTLQRSALIGGKK